MKKCVLTALAAGLCCVATTFGQVPSYIPTSGLVGWWPFNGNANDESGNGHNGSLINSQNGLNFTSDRNNFTSSAIQLNSNTNGSQSPYIDIANTSGIIMDFYTVNFWVNADNYDQAAEIINKGSDQNSFFSRFQGLNGVAFGSVPSYVNYSMPIATSSWHMYTFVRDNLGVGKLYLDGILLYSQNISIPTNNADNFAFGLMPSGGSNGSYYPFKGKLDDIGIWNRALSDQEISNVYTETTPMSCLPSYVPTNGLVGYWPFCGNADDESGNANHGTVNGATLISDRFGNSNGAYNFSGSQSIVVPHNSAFNMGSNFTISLWFTVDDFNNVRTLINKNRIGNGNQDYFNVGILPTSGTLYTQFGDGSLVDNILNPTSPNINTWYNVTFSVNDSVRLYVNGQLIESHLRTIVPKENTENISFGYWQTQTSTFHYGKIDDIGIWNRELTPCEVADLYNAQVGSANTSSTQTLGTCGSYTWNGNTYTQSGQYTFLTTNAHGCDSTATLNLTINQPTTSSTSHAACSSYSWNGTTYTQSGQYNFQTNNAQGCDSTATLNLTINQPTTSSTAQTACSSYSWNGTTYTQNGQYTFHTTNALGCDSTATLNLTINQPTTSSTAHAACGSYSWNGTTYTQSGQYTFLTTNAKGCDSTATLNLTINQPTTSSTSHAACGSYSWNGTTYTQSGQYTFLTTNAHGCDSTATLNLTINQPTSSSTSQTECGSFSWNGTIYTQSGQYTFLTTNAHGCDSTATLNLTINQPTTSSTSHAACSSYSWNGTTYTQSGQYTFLTTNAHGCDSTATLNLTINQHTSATQTQSAIDNYTWPVNGQTYSQSGSYNAVIPNSVGCDSTITLNLTMNYTGLSDLKTNAIKLYPNPAKDFVTIELTNELIGKQYLIFNELGQVMQTGRMTSNKVIIPIDKMVTGSYSLHIERCETIYFNVITD
jgi:hypothetical protein